MSKENSGLFKGTSGSNATIKTSHKQNLIISRVTGMDLREHPREKSLTAKQKKSVKNKISARTATRREYKKFESDRRFAERRKEGVKKFWMQERRRILNGEITTREWSNKQKNAILGKKRPSYNGKTIQGHHMFSASKYPHLANRGEVIFPVTFDEHLYGWHGGNFKTSLPGRPINYSKKHNFGR